MSNRHTALVALLKELPKEHYNTLRALMLHLNRVTAASANNLMTSQNLGVVFGREYHFSLITGEEGIVADVISNSHALIRS